MSTKKGYIVIDKDGKCYIGDKVSAELGYAIQNPISIHPSSLPTILSNGSLKPEYQGEVEYEFWKCVCVDREDKMSCEHYDFDGNCSRTKYAIPRHNQK